MHEWVNLTTRIGESIQNPQTDQLRAALDELFASKDEEHPDSWVECGSEQGPLYSLTFFYSGRGIYTQYSDADMTEELENREIKVSGPAEALQLWEYLISGLHEKL
ncbi:hypothetical protein BFW38_03960 [Terasakiispira papahanaumokuakeensis]|uniref:Uncharacterized protein n=1 Tax=Terasakiispira papahanaumokuakeensis TaxID=197479 RepID=A0A1E2V769_9GAMM|nr:hypothetical protein [Terasakiispira papahanaumokuakeensis]ODC02831.1 hypothetical protein BFW38_03960 [Terasakiispira papahanaumokuakeensis]